MSFNPLDRLAQADALAAEGTEAARRTAIGRYYYAVFLQARRSLEHDRRYVPRQSREDHGGVIAALRTNKRRLAGDALGVLSDPRATADYELDASVGPDDVTEARRTALEIARLLRDHWARLAAQP